MDSESATISKLVVLARARKAGSRARLAYRDAGDALTEREVDVLGISFQEGRWYVMAHCHLRRGLRLFRVDRIVAASLSRRKTCGFTLRNFDPAFFSSVEFLTPGAPVAHLATVRLHGRLATVAQALFPGAILERDGRDRLCHLRVSRVPVLEQLVGSLGAGASVEAPVVNAAPAGTRPLMPI